MGDKNTSKEVSSVLTQVPLWGMWVMGEAMYVSEQKVYGKFQYHLLNFIVNLKL